MRTLRFYCWTLLLLGCVTLGFSACQPSPRTKESTTSERALGSFQLNQRHGLGAWQGPTQPSQRELMRTMSQSPTLLPPAKPFVSEKEKN